LKALSNLEYEAMHAFAAYLYCTSGVKFAGDIFPGSHPDYLAEYAEAWAISPARAIGKLDEDNMRKLFELMLERHGR